eukprot:TRINITY_DN4594_c0_g1_i2.p1 TRINITY_DN4594_c0_g1~~TRINITY_DN4594_c0_g1_i2.p1  ORF type:complete len:1373 (+),score=262.27 TRINITY_DN4594_c0_g1_i2:168-4286(+)
MSLSNDADESDIESIVQRELREFAYDPSSDETVSLSHGWDIDASRPSSALTLSLSSDSRPTSARSIASLRPSSAMRAFMSLYEGRQKLVQDFEAEIQEAKSLKLPDVSAFISQEKLEKLERGETLFSDRPVIDLDEYPEEASEEAKEELRIEMERKQERERIRREQDLIERELEEKRQRQREEERKKLELQIKQKEEELRIRQEQDKIQQEQLMREQQKRIEKIQQDHQENMRRLEQQRRIEEENLRVIEQDKAKREKERMEREELERKKQLEDEKRRMELENKRLEEEAARKAEEEKRKREKELAEQQEREQKRIAMEMEQKRIREEAERKKREEEEAQRLEEERIRRQIAEQQERQRRIEAERKEKQENERRRLQMLAVAQEKLIQQLRQMRLKDQVIDSLKDLASSTTKAGPARHARSLRKDDIEHQRKKWLGVLRALPSKDPTRLQAYVNSTPSSSTTKGKKPITVELLKSRLLNLPADTVQTIDLGLEGLDQISELHRFQELRSLHLNSNNISQLSGLDGCRRLETLQIKDNKLASLDGLYQLTNLMDLVIDGNSIVRLDGIQGCKNLRSISASHNKLSSLKGLEYCSRLEKLNASNNQLSTLSGLEYHSFLQSLDVSHNNLQDLDQLSYCRSLSVLVAGHNKLADFPKGLGNALLRELWVNHNQIQIFDGPLFLPLLEKLSLTENRVSRIGDLQGLIMLTRLDLSFNNIAEASAIIPLTNLVRLKDLQLNDNPICHIADYRDRVISSLTTLEELDVQPLSSNESLSARLALQSDNVDMLVYYQQLLQSGQAYTSPTNLKGLILDAAFRETVLYDQSRFNADVDMWHTGTYMSMCEVQSMRRTLQGQEHRRQTNRPSSRSNVTLKQASEVQNMLTEFHDEHVHYKAHEHQNRLFTDRGYLEKQSIVMKRKQGLRIWHFWRKAKFRRGINNRIESKLMDNKKNRAALKIQRAWRRYRTHQLPRRRQLRSLAAVRIQALWRGHIVRSRLKIALEQLKGGTSDDDMEYGGVDDDFLQMPDLDAFDAIDFEAAQKSAQSIALDMMRRSADKKQRQQRESTFDTKPNMAVQQNAPKMNTQIHSLLVSEAAKSSVVLSSLSTKIGIVSSNHIPAPPMSIPPRPLRAFEDDTPAFPYPIMFEMDEKTRVKQATNSQHDFVDTTQPAAHETRKTAAPSSTGDNGANDGNGWQISDPATLEAFKMRQKKQQQHMKKIESKQKMADPAARLEKFHQSSSKEQTHVPGQLKEVLRQRKKKHRVDYKWLGAAPSEDTISLHSITSEEANMTQNEQKPQAVAQQPAPSPPVRIGAGHSLPSMPIPSKPAGPLPISRRYDEGPILEFTNELTNRSGGSSNPQYPGGMTRTVVPKNQVRKRP